MIRGVAGRSTLSCNTTSKAWIIRVECHHSGGLICSATAADEAPRFAWILQTGLNLPAGKASLNSLLDQKRNKSDGAWTGTVYSSIRNRYRTWERNGLDGSEPQRPPKASVDTYRVVV